MTEVLPFLIGGLAIFIYSINRLSRVMEKLFTDRAKETVQKYTNNLYVSILIGSIITVFLGSSSAVIIITIIFVNANTLNFKRAIGIVMGANIGTTFSSQMIALDIEKYSVILLVAGVLILVFNKKGNFRRMGQVIFYFGLLFYGLLLMQESATPLNENNFFEKWMTKIDNNYLEGVLSGGLITLIIQSSSATVGLAIILGKQKLISATAGISIMLGAELGTCSDTLLATINGNRDAIKTGLYHFIFNLLTIILGIILFSPFVDLVKYVSINGDIDRIIANAHIMFNVLGVISFLPFVRLVENLLNKLIPSQELKLDL